MTEPKRIVVINDTKEILELFRDVLEVEMGHDVVLMSFAPDELARIADEKPDLVIIDFIIGDREMEGWQLLQKLRMFKPTAQVPIIACTAAVRQVRESEAYLLEQGVEVVLKPFSIDQLEDAVHRALQVGESTATVRAARQRESERPAGKRPAQKAAKRRRA